MNREAAGSEFDAIVVGSGPAGATVARDLSRRGKRVLVLERGGDGPLSEGLGMAPILRSVSVGDDLAAVSAFTTGGTTAVYFAVAEPPPFDVFARLGVDLRGTMEDVRSDLPLAVVPDELLGAQSLRARQSAEELGYACRRGTMLVDLSKCASGYHYSAKWNARTFIRDAVAHGATLLTRARAVKVLVTGNRAIGVEYRVRTGRTEGEPRQAFAAKIILAAGGAVSPLIVRNSGLTKAASSGFYCHPGFAMFGTIRGLNARDTFVGSMGTTVDGDINVGDGSPARAFYRMMMLSNRRWMRIFRHSTSIGIGVMVADGVGGALLEDGRYRKQLSRETLLKLSKGEQVARRILENAGGRQIVKLSTSAAHVGGTLRIGVDVDRNLETEYRNLYVCDGSVIPEQAFVSPTLTLICLARYMARRLWADPVAVASHHDAAPELEPMSTN